MRTAAALVLCLAFAPVAVADDPVVLKWVLKEDDTFYAKSVVLNDMKIEVLGMNQDVNMKMTTVTKYKVKSVKPDATVVEMTYTDVQMDADALPGVGNIGEKMKGLMLTATFDQDMEITKVEGYDKFLDKLADGDPMTKQLMQMVMPESASRAMFGQVFIPLPAKGVKTGESWARTEKLPLAGLGDLTSKAKYTLESSTDGIAKVKQDAQMTFAPGKGGGPKGLPFKITKANLKSDDFTGSLLFDVKAGRLKEMKQSMTVKGTITISAGGQDIDAGIEQKSVTTVTISEKNPVTD